MQIPVPALADFTQRLDAASWFSVVGEALTPGEHADASTYLTHLGLADVATRELATWGDAEACIKAADWAQRWWDAEDQRRRSLLASAQARFGDGATLAALSAISEQVSGIVHGAAAVAATRVGVADAGLIRAAAGAATMACYQAAVEIAARSDPDCPFIAKYRLFEAGHWPLCVRGAADYVF